MFLIIIMVRIVDVGYGDKCDNFGETLSILVLSLWDREVENNEKLTFGTRLIQNALRNYFRN